MLIVTIGWLAEALKGMIDSNKFTQINKQQNLNTALFNTLAII
jgi:hypothetical protein